MCPPFFVRSAGWFPRAAGVQLTQSGTIRRRASRQQVARIGTVSEVKRDNLARGATKIASQGLKNYD
jgi:hypothetical protein